MSYIKPLSNLQEFYTRYFAKLLPQVKTVPKLDEMAEYLLKVSDLVWGIYALSRDPLQGRFNPTQSEDWIRQALSCGKKYAKCYISMCGTDNPKQIAQYLDITINKPLIPEEGGRVLFARFIEPDTIEIFGDVLEKVSQLGSLSEFPDCSSEWEKILTAHELFHVVELRNETEIFTRKHHLTIFSIGPFKNQARVNALSEIAAMSFARELCHLTYLPFALDVLLTYGYNYEAAGMLFDEIRDINETYRT